VPGLFPVSKLSSLLCGDLSKIFIGFCVVISSGAKV